MNGTTFWRLLKLARPLWSWMLLATLLGFATVASGIGLMTISAYLIAEAALHPSYAALSVAIVGVRFFGLARGTLRYSERLMTHQATFRLLARLRVWLYGAIEPLAPARLLHDVHSNSVHFSSGDLLSRIVSDIETLQNFYTRVLAPPLVAAPIGAGMWFLFGAFHPVLALAFLTLFLISATGIPLLAYVLSQKASQQVVTARSVVQSRLIESLQGMADALAFGQEEQQAAQMRSLNQQYMTAQARMAHIGGLQEALTSLFMNGTAWVMLVMAIPLVRSGQLSGVFLPVLVLGVLSSFEAVLPLPASFQQLGSSLAAARRLFDLVDAEPAVRDPAVPVSLPAQYDLVVEHVSFRYNDEEASVLDDVSFTLRQGQCLALVGASGTGKTTFTHLLLRFWDYQQGHILLGGRELRSLAQDDVRGLFSVVTQDTHLFNTTIRQNLLLARPRASEEEMMQAARQACMHDFILSLPHGYDTEVGEQGLRLSGGERQRLAIARAILKDTPLLILDEPTANLDAVTEHAIVQTLQAIIRGRTTLLITHHLAPWMGVTDEILALKAPSQTQCMTTQVTTSP